MGDNLDKLTRHVGAYIKDSPKNNIKLLIVLIVWHSVFKTLRKINLHHIFKGFILLSFPTLRFCFNFYYYSTQSCFLTPFSGIFLHHPFATNVFNVPIVNNIPKGRIVLKY